MNPAIVPILAQNRGGRGKNPPNLVNSLVNLKPPGEASRTLVCYKHLIMHKRLGLLGKQEGVQKGNHSPYKVLAAQLQWENRGNVYVGRKW